MRLFVLLASLLWLSPLSAGTATPSSARVRFQDRDWHDLSAWARARSFSFNWNRQTKLVTLTNTAARLVFAIDSQQVVVNGIKVWLCFPVAAIEGRVLLSVLDSDMTLAPLLKGTRPRAASRVRTIVVDAGHGGRDPGNQEGTSQEKKYTLLLAEQVRTKLQAAGYKVVMTRTRDTYVDLEERAAIANRAKADLFLSLHFNDAGSGDRSVRGIEVFCLTPAGAASTHAPRSAVSRTVHPGQRYNAWSTLLGYEVLKTVILRLGMTDRGVKRARFAVLRDLAMPGILIEAGFMSAPDEQRKIADPAFRERLAGAIVDGVQLYRRLVEVSPAPARRR